MDVLFIIFLILVACVALIWLGVHAWKKDVLWGLAVFSLAPITPTIYAIKNWNEVKTPFLIYSISFMLLMFTAPEIMFTEDGAEKLFTKGRIEQPASKTAPTRVESIFPQKVIGVQEKSAALENLEFRSRPIPASDPGSRGPRFKVISPAEARDYIGARVIFTGRNDVERKGWLIGVSGDRLRIERRVSRGKVSYEYKARDIKSLKVLLK